MSFKTQRTRTFVCGRCGETFHEVYDQPVSDWNCPKCRYRNTVPCPKNPDGQHRYDVRTNQCADCGVV